MLVPIKTSHRQRQAGQPSTGTLFPTQQPGDDNGADDCCADNTSCCRRRQRLKGPGRACLNRHQSDNRDRQTCSYKSPHGFPPFAGGANRDPPSGGTVLELETLFPTPKPSGDNGADDCCPDKTSCCRRRQVVQGPGRACRNRHQSDNRDRQTCSYKSPHGFPRFAGAPTGIPA